MNNIDELKKLAEQGNDKAQNYLGAMYLQGVGVKKDNKKAEEWFKKAADNGNVKAQFNLATLYYNNQRYEKAAEYYEKAAKNGDAEAKFHLATMYEDGKGVEQNYEKALEWYEKVATEDNNDRVQNYLGSMYADGRVVKKDKKKAEEWFKKAVNNGNVEAQYILGILYEQEGRYKEAFKYYEDAAKKGYSPAQCNLGLFYLQGKGTKEDHQKGLKLLKKSADNDNANAQYNLGIIYCYKEEYIKKDYREALKWFKKAANNGSVEAQCNLGVFYIQGKLIEKDYEEALKWLKKSADNAHVKAQYNLGIMYFQGDGVIENYEEAEKWFQQAADQGHVYAQYNLGVIYKYGQKNELAEEWFRQSKIWFNNALSKKNRFKYHQYDLENNKEAEKCFIKAEERFKKEADKTNVEAQYNLGVMYYKGEGVKQDYKEAEQWFQQAANKDYANAQYMLGKMYSLGSLGKVDYQYALKYYFEALKKINCTNYILEIFEKDIEYIKYTNNNIKNKNTNYLINILISNYNILEKFKNNYFNLLNIAMSIHSIFKLTRVFIDSKLNEIYVGNYHAYDNLLKYILDDDKNNKFRLNPINFMNDPLEGKVLNTIFNINKREEYTQGQYCFIKSFSFNIDSLTLFRLYGKKDGEEGTGVCSVFNEAFFNTTTANHNIVNNYQYMNTDLYNKEQYNEKAKALALYRCVYIDTESFINNNELILELAHQDQKTFISNNKEIHNSNYNWESYLGEIKKKTEKIKKSLMDIESNCKKIIKENDNNENIEDIKTLIAKLLLPLSFLIKDYAFKEEQECRCIHSTNDINDKDIQYNDKYIFFNYKLPYLDYVKQIILGPVIANNKIYIDKLLKDKKKSNIILKSSKAPLNTFK